MNTVAAKSLQSCLTLCDPIDGSPPGSSVPGILQARILEWVAISFSNAWKWKVKVKLLSRARLLATPWTAAHQAPPSMGFSRQEYWSGVPLPSLSLGIGISNCFRIFVEKLLFLHQLPLHVCKILSCSCMLGSISLLFILIYLLILIPMPYCLYCYSFMLSSWRRDGYPLQYSCLENSGQRSLESSWVTEWLTLHFYNVLKSGSVSFPNYWSLS